MRIFHIATVADWEEARARGAYTTSTRGRTLEEEGFIHASRREQVAGTFRSFYADAREPLLLLTVDTDRLDVPWREDPVGEDTFPHVYGAIPPRAVVHVAPLNRRGGTESLTSLFFKEMVVRILLGILAMLLAFAGSEVGGRLLPGWGPLLGALVGLALGVGLFVLLLRRRG